MRSDDMSTQFFCSFSAGQARQHGIPRGGYVEIHANDQDEAREVATKWFPPTRDLPFGGWAELYTEDELAQSLRFFPKGRLGVANKTHRTWIFTGEAA